MKDSHFRQRLILIIAGISLECLYILYFLRTFPLLPYHSYLSDLGTMTSHTLAGFWTYIFIFSLLFLLFGISWYIIRASIDRVTLWIIASFGLLFGLTMMLVYPITANDIYNYVAQSRILTHYQQNPIFVPALTYPKDPIMVLTGDWGKYGSPYGPIGIVINALPSYVVQGNLLANLLLLKLMFTLGILMTAFVIYKIVQHLKPHAAASAALFIAWNPLLLFEISANGHNDIAMMLFMVLALFFMVKGYYKIGVLLLVLSALVKYVTILFLPIFLIYALIHLPSLRKRLTYFFTTALASLVLVAATYFPFWEGPSTFSRVFYEGSLYLQSFSSLSGNLLNGFSYFDGLVLGRVLFGIFYCYFLFTLFKNKSKENLLWVCFWTILLFLTFAASNFKIWYALWPVILAGTLPKFLERGAATLFAFGASVSVVIFSFFFMWIDSSVKVFAMLNNSAYLIAFAPAFLFFIIGVIFTKIRKRAIIE